ncbi:MAG: hypothetical protein ACOX87_04900 [Chloroflexota bacterium]|jgi:hypothetical protein
MPNEKYEDEIRNILNRMDQFIPEENTGPRQQQRRPNSSSNPWAIWLTGVKRQLYGYNSTSLLVGWVMFALAAGILHKVYQPFGVIAAVLSVACLMGAILLPMLSRRYGQPEHRWRGRVIDYQQPIRLRRPFSWRYTWWRIKTFFGFR